MDPIGHRFFLIRISSGTPRVIAIDTQTGGVVESQDPVTSFNFLGFDFDVPPAAVVIDVKPGSFPNSINPRSRGKTPVAVLTTSTALGEALDFDATTVDPATVRFGATGTEAAPVHWALEDADGDGDTDLILHFATQSTGIACGNTVATLTGATFGGSAIAGSDSINTVGCH